MSSVKKFLKKIRNFFINIFGSSIDELYWRFRHGFDKSWAQEYLTDESINHPHRKFLLDRVLTYSPFENCLEIGCASGPNLFLLAKELPKTRLYGFDISKNAIDFGNRFFKEHSIGNVFLRYGNGIHLLKKMQAKSVDLIFTDASLIYFDKSRVASMIREMVRVAKKAIIMLELNTNQNSYYDGHWIHDYKNIIKEIGQYKSVKFTKLPKEIWRDNWESLGCLIEVSL